MLDGDVFVAGSSGDDFPSAVDAGAAHVFVETAGVWSEEQQLIASVPHIDNMFGWSVALVGDTAVVGIPERSIHPFGRVGADLPAGGGVTYLATCTVAASSGQCSNTAGVTPPVGVIDPNPLDNDATDTDDVIGLADIIFDDGFESGDASAWTGVTP